VTGLVLYIAYGWSGKSERYDLDGGVFFLGGARGPTCEPHVSTYMSFSGDVYGPSGKEEFNVNLGKALVDGKWSGSTTVQLRAGWFDSDSGGQATITMSTKRVQANGASVEDNNAISFVFNPPSRQAYFECAPPVADAKVVIGTDGSVTTIVTFPY
jgi:hypothetical protein